MLPRVVLIVVLITGLASSQVMAAPAPEAAEKFIQKLGDDAINVLEKKDVSMSARESELETLLAKGFDMPFLARLALGREYRSLDDQQKSEYEELFNEYILTTYSRRFTGFHGIELNVLGTSKLNDDDILVKSEVKSTNGPPVNVDWRIRERNGQLKIIDVVIEGVSMVISQRQEFQSIVQRDGLDGLISLLRARSDRATASTSQGS